MSYTPGPWAVAFEYDACIYPQHSCPDSVPDGAAIHLPKIAEAPKYSDLRLIAAAPELLEACKKALEFFVQFDVQQKIISGLGLQLNEAIAKAQGN